MVWGKIPEWFTDIYRNIDNQKIRPMRNLTFFVLTGFLVLALAFTNRGHETGKSTLSEEDAMKIRQWDLLFGKKDNNAAAGNDHVVAPYTVSRPVPANYAQACINAFQALFNNPSNAALQAFARNITHSIRFRKDGSDGVSDAGGPRGENLYAWIGKHINDRSSATHFEISFGIYLDPNSYVYPYKPGDANYDSAEAAKYLDQMVADYIRGIRTNKNLVGRLTVFIKPYKAKSSLKSFSDDPQDDGPDDFFNLGDLQP
jgi:hypothetical protein